MKFSRKSCVLCAGYALVFCLGLMHRNSGAIQQPEKKSPVITIEPKAGQRIRITINEGEKQDTLTFHCLEDGKIGMGDDRHVQFVASRYMRAEPRTSEAPQYRIHVYNRFD